MEQQNLAQVLCNAVIETLVERDLLIRWLHRKLRSVVCRICDCLVCLATCSVTTTSQTQRRISSLLIWSMTALNNLTWIYLKPLCAHVEMCIWLWERKVQVSEENGLLVKRIRISRSPMTRTNRLFRQLNDLLQNSFCVSERRRKRLLSYVVP